MNSFKKYPNKVVVGVIITLVHMIKGEDDLVSVQWYASSDCTNQSGR